MSKESSCNAGDMGSLLGSGRYPGGRHGNPLQFFCSKNPMDKRSLEGCSPQCCKESDMTEVTERTHKGETIAKIIKGDFLACYISISESKAWRRLKSCPATFTCR